MDPNMLSKSSKASKIMPKIKTIACQEPLEWQKRTIGRQKTTENNEKTSIKGINIDTHSNRQIWPINGPALIDGSQSTKAIGRYQHRLYGTCDNNH